MAEAKRRPVDPANFFLLASLILGVLYCLAIPYGAGFDEERHLVRIYYMSQGHLMPDFPNQSIHEAVFDLSYQRRLVQTPAFDMFTTETLTRRFSGEGERMRYGQRTQSIYSPVIFLPQALIGRALWWKFDLPVLPVIFLQRLAGLLMYVAGGYFAIRVIPFGKWILAALALLPAAMYQAATLNADGFTYAVSFAFIGWVLFVYVNERSGVRPRSVWAIVGLSILLGLSKPVAIILLPLLFILIGRPFPSRKWILLLIAGLLLAVVLNVGWWALASQASPYGEEGSQSVSRQMGSILVNPSGFIAPLVQGFILTFPDQVRGWIAGFGYGAGAVPGPVYFFTAVLLLAALLAEPNPVELPKAARIFLAGLFLFCFLGMYTIAFAANYATGGLLALVKHGRYYIPFVPLLFLGVAGLFPVREHVQREARFVAIGSFLLVTAFHSFGIYTTYYSYCWYGAYVGEKCLLPVYKNLEKEETPEVTIQTDAPVMQTFVNQCGRLESVQVFVKFLPDDPAGSLRFSLLDDARRALASRDFPLGDIAARDYLELRVVTPPDSRDGTYTIRLEAVGLASPFEEIIVSGTRSDYYPGKLSANGIEKNYDLLMRYICAGP
jgi:uncharacterized membrane protein